VATATHARVLVVYGQDSVREVLRELLEFAGYQVLTARTLAEALPVLDAGGVRVILADLIGANSPESDRSCIESLHRAAPAIPIIVRADHLWGDAQLPADHGLVAVLPMPFDLDALLRAIERAVPREAPGAGHAA
jgi:DNA-binding NtrC family response regulator